MFDHTSNSCSVYVIQSASGAVKIGIANNPTVRLGEVQMYNHEPLKLLYVLEVGSREIAFAIEALLHQRYGENALHGEWFTVNAAKLIDDIRFATTLARLVKSFSVEDESKRVFHGEEDAPKRVIKSDSDLALVAIKRARQYGRISCAKLRAEFGVDDDTAAWLIKVMVKSEYISPSTHDADTYIFSEQKYKDWRLSQLKALGMKDTEIQDWILHDDS